MEDLAQGSTIVRLARIRVDTDENQIHAPMHGMRAREWEGQVEAVANEEVEAEEEVELKGDETVEQEGLEEVETEGEEKVETEGDRK